MIQTQSILTGNVHVCVAPVAESPGRARQWELVEFAGLGSLAHIYRARPVGTPADRPATYAVKMLRPCWENDDQAIRPEVLLAALKWEPKSLESRSSE